MVGGRLRRRHARYTVAQARGTPPVACAIVAPAAVRAGTSSSASSSSQSSNHQHWQCRTGACRHSSSSSGTGGTLWYKQL
eukprot:COSAG01_NODE_1685_length_9495_cov_61.609728_3_plen_80_part_00